MDLALTRLLQAAFGRGRPCCWSRPSFPLHHPPRTGSHTKADKAEREESLPRVEKRRNDGLIPKLPKASGALLLLSCLPPASWAQHQFPCGASLLTLPLMLPYSHLRHREWPHLNLSSESPDSDPARSDHREGRMPELLSP